MIVRQKPAKRIMNKLANAQQTHLELVQRCQLLNVVKFLMNMVVLMRIGMAMMEFDKPPRTLFCSSKALKNVLEYFLQQ